VRDAVPVVQGAAKTIRFFDHIAPWYDRINARIYKREWLARVRSEIRGNRVLDVGVGTGFTTGHLPTAVGIDLSGNMLRRARYRAHLIRADLMRPPFRPNTFDTIVFAGSFYYMRSPDGASKIAADMLRPGGRVIILSPATPLLAPFVRVYRPEEYRRFMAGAGLHLAIFERLNWAACLVLAEKPVSKPSVASVGNR
jgi:ubiquinone/menaquinone biosynthesis C-methylase UbiE